MGSINFDWYFENWDSLDDATKAWLVGIIFDDLWYIYLPPDLSEPDHNPEIFDPFEHLFHHKFEIPILVVPNPRYTPNPQWGGRTGIGEDEADARRDRWLKEKLKLRLQLGSPDVTTPKYRTVKDLLKGKPNPKDWTADDLLNLGSELLTLLTDPKFQAVVLAILVLYFGVNLGTEEILKGLFVGSNMDGWDSDSQDSIQEEADRFFLKTYSDTLSQTFSDYMDEYNSRCPQNEDYIAWSRRHIQKLRALYAVMMLGEISRVLAEHRLGRGTSDPADPARAVLSLLHKAPPFPFPP